LDLAGVDFRVADNNTLPPLHLVDFVQRQHQLFRVLYRPDDVSRLHLPTHSEFVCRFSEAAHLCKPTVTDKNDNKSCKKSTTRARNRQSQLNTSPGGKPQRHTQMCMNKKNDHAQKRQLRLSKTTDTG